VLRGVPAVRLSAGNGASFSAFRQHTRVRLLPALRFGSVSDSIRHGARRLPASSHIDTVYPNGGT
jgi:hypothetical protein